MARCFPYPPTDYVMDDSNGVPLVESIKLLQKEMEKPKERKKEEKREQTERRATRKEAHVNPQLMELSRKQRTKHGERSHLNEKVKRRTRTTKGSSIQLVDRSGLTEENGLPCSIPNPCDSDSFQGSSKRTTLAPPEVTNNSYRRIFRFKLSLKKHTDAERPCLSGSVADAQPLEKHREAPAASEPTCLSKRVVEKRVLPKDKAPELPPAIMDQPCISGRNVEPAVSGAAGTQSSSGSSRSQESERQFTELILNWNPPVFQFELPDGGDEELLFWAKQQCSGNRSSERYRGASNAEVADHGSGDVRSCARYLAEFEMYQLPYVVPL